MIEFPCFPSFRSEIEVERSKKRGKSVCFFSFCHLFLSLSLLLLLPPPTTSPPPSPSERTRKCTPRRPSTGPRPPSPRRRRARAPSATLCRRRRRASERRSRRARRWRRGRRRGARGRGGSSGRAVFFWSEGGGAGFGGERGQRSSGLKGRRKKQNREEATTGDGCSASLHHRSWSLSLSLVLLARSLFSFAQLLKTDRTSSSPSWLSPSFNGCAGSPGAGATTRGDAGDGIDGAPPPPSTSTWWWCWRFSAAVTSSADALSPASCPAGACWCGWRLAWRNGCL